MRKLSVLLIVLSVAVSLFANGENETASQDGVRWIQYWSSSSRVGVYDESHPFNKILEEEVGVGLLSPQISWNGGKDYLQKLNLSIASGEMPEVFLPWAGNELELAEEGAIMPLDDLLPQYAPTVWNDIPQNVWDMVRANSPDGKIYYIPSVKTDFTLAAMIRQDWLDRVGMDMPGTIEEYEDVLRAFKSQDANGNGDPNDEIPTSGRENARWMDHLFAPYGVAIWEGNPEWDMYDGELTYSGVTTEMRDALEWIAGLYEEGLLDKETLLNTTKMWDGKVRDNRVGSWYHGAQWVQSRFQSIEKLDPEVNVKHLPVLDAPGHEGFYTAKTYTRPEYVFSAADEKDVIAGLKAIEFVSAESTMVKYPGGYPGFNVKTVDGKLVAMTQPEGYAGTMPPPIQNPTYWKSRWALTFDDPTIGPLAKMAFDVMVDTKTDMKEVEGQKLPMSIYEDYPDIQTHVLFREYATQIIMGEYDIEKFDEFVEIWYERGGQIVTDRARAVYSQM